MKKRRIPLYRNPTFRGVFVQGCLIVAVGLLIWLSAINVFNNMARRGLASGFNFLSDPAGFDIIFSLLTWNEGMSNGRAFIVALLNTILVSFLSIIFATILGFIVGIMRLSSNWLIRKMGAFWVESIRNIPLLLQLFLWYFGFMTALEAPRNSHQLWDIFFINVRGLYFPWPLSPWLYFGAGCSLLIFVWTYTLSGIALKKKAVISGLSLIVFLVCILNMSYSEGGFQFETPKLLGFNYQGGAVLVPELLALFLGLSTYTSAFIAEIIRAGIQSVPRGQLEASAALGFGRLQSLRLILIPQAMRVIIPPLANQYLNLTKNSSLGSAIAYPELVLIFTGTVLGQTGMAVEIVAMTMGVYLLLSLFIAFLMNVYNGWVLRHGGGV